MLGVVLCGGQSSRMGSDKGMLPSAETTWAQAAVHKLASLNIGVKVCINSEQYPVYAAYFSATDLITDDASLPVKGPLLGILSSHLQYPKEDLFVMACDMPLLAPSLLQLLYNNYLHESPFDAFVFANENEPEPLCSIYKANGLSAIFNLLVAGNLPKHSVKFMLNQMNTMLIPITVKQQKFFRNFNEPESLIEL